MPESLPGLIVPAHVRTGIVCIAAATIVFVVALALFCVALGLDFQSEGWSSDVADADGVATWDGATMMISTIGFLVSIVLFFVGVQRVSQSS